MNAEEIAKDWLHNSNKLIAPSRHDKECWGVARALLVAIQALEFYANEHGQIAVDALTKIRSEGT